MISSRNRTGTVQVYVAVSMESKHYNYNSFKKIRQKSITIFRVSQNN